MPVQKPLPTTQVITLGCDPEFFFTKGDRVLGSEKVITGKGIPAWSDFGPTEAHGLTVIDGVQAEIHPAPKTCRQELASNIQRCLEGVARAMAKDVKADFSQVVEVSQEELDTMADENKVFGCSASMNTHKKGKDKITTVDADPLKYLKRSAGGHIHMGANPTVGVAKYKDVAYTASEMEENVVYYGPDASKTYKQYAGQEIKDSPHFLALKNPDVLVPLLDVIVGNTSVLLDRNPANVERRKNYGKAGEYRLPAYGLEYRTLSNFWLRSPALFSLMFGLARMCVNMVVYDKDGDFVNQIMSKIDMKDITKAINQNDFDLALSNWNKIESTILLMTKGGSGFYPIYDDTIKAFHKLIDNGIDHYFKQDAMDAWLKPKVHLGPRDGFGSFCYHIFK